MTTNLLDTEPDAVGTQDPVARQSTSTTTPTANANAPDGGSTGADSTNPPAVGEARDTSPPAVTPPFSLPSRPTHANPPTSNEPEPRSPPTPIEYPASPIQQNLPPEVESLKAMFPDFDAETLHSVLASVGGNQERATDLLLGMSDPNYQSQEAAGPTQTELDEQFARRLLLEEQQRQQPQYAADPRWQPQQHDPYGYSRRPGQGTPEAGIDQMYGDGGQRTSAGASGGQGSGRDTMTEVQEQLGRFAETGKRTFSSLLTKVKAKMQEFEQNRNAQNQASQSNQQSNWGGDMVISQAPGSQAPGSQAPGSQAPSARTQTQPQPQYYDPTPISLSDNRSPGVQGYDTTAPAPSPAAQPQSQSQSWPQPRLSTEVGRRSGDAQLSTSPSRVDPTKIGLLPKRPVSLGGTTPAPSSSNAVGQSGSTQAQNRRVEDDDELDYVENPFEDGRK